MSALDDKFLAPRGEERAQIDAREKSRVQFESMEHTPTDDAHLAGPLTERSRWRPRPRGDSLISGAGLSYGLLCREERTCAHARVEARASERPDAGRLLARTRHEHARRREDQPPPSPRRPYSFTRPRARADGGGEVRCPRAAQSNRSNQSEINAAASARPDTPKQHLEDLLRHARLAMPVVRGERLLQVLRVVRRRLHRLHARRELDATAS